MTERSRRRDAEMNVIVKAVEFIESDNETLAEYIRLAEAVEKYRELEIEKPFKALAPIRSTDTAAEAAESVLHQVGSLAEQCWDRIRSAYMQGHGGLTCDELESQMGGRHQTISPRVNELRDNGWIVDSGERRRTRSGRRAIVWRPTSMSLHPSVRS